MYSEQLGDFSPKNKDIISTTFKDYEILYGFDKFIERVVSQNPILLLSSDTMKGQTPISKEFEGELYYQILDNLPIGVNIIEETMGLPDKNTIEPQGINLFDNAYYSLSLGHLTLEEVNTIVLTKKDTGLPFHLLLSKDKKYETTEKKTFLEEYAAYHLVKQIFDSEFVENFIERATQMAQIFTDLVINTRKTFRWQTPVKVVTPSVAISKEKAYRRFDFMKLVYNGLNPIEVYLYYSYLFSETDALKEQAFFFLTTTMINNKKAGH